ncbi:MAG TPA: hypothetical protein VM938_00025 [Acidimicrobiales bacterium]|nr:hypothetical protein [Acidimicrobiales bacterium]
MGAIGACGRYGSRSSTSAPASIPTCSPSPKPPLDDTGDIADKRLRGRFDDTIANFLVLVEASTHYPCVKRAWVEFLGEAPDPAIDRVDT